jgi:hypothetical protein
MKRTVIAHPAPTIVKPPLYLFIKTSTATIVRVRP